MLQCLVCFMYDIIISWTPMTMTREVEIKTMETFIVMYPPLLPQQEHPVIYGVMHITGRVTIHHLEFWPLFSFNLELCKKKKTSFPVATSHHVFQWSTVHTFNLSVPKSTHWHQIVHSCLSYWNSGEVACLSGPLLSGAVSWTWDERIRNLNKKSPRHISSSTQTRNGNTELGSGCFSELCFVVRFIVVTQRSLPIACVCEPPCGERTQHVEQHHCMFKNVLQWTNRCRIVQLDRIPASPRWAAGRGHNTTTGFVSILHWGKTHATSIVILIFCHEIGNLAKNLSSICLSLFYIQTYPAARACIIFRCLCDIILMHTVRIFPRNLLHVFNINTQSVSRFFSTASS